MQAYTDELRDGGHSVNNVPHTNTYQEALPENDRSPSRRATRFHSGKAPPEVRGSAGYRTPPSSHPGLPFPSRISRKTHRRTKETVHGHLLSGAAQTDGHPRRWRWKSNRGAVVFRRRQPQKTPKNHEPPSPPKTERNPYAEAAINHIERHFPDNPGLHGKLPLPRYPRGRKVLAERLIADRFADFGAYEDAISTRHPFINHSLLTPMLNIGLLTPQEIIDAALSTRKKIPINSLEGFVRQIIGWREFMHGIYRHKGVEIRNMNFLKNTRPIPQSFYEGTTGIPPIDRVIKQLNDEAYCHHIERLRALSETSCSSADSIRTRFTNGSWNSSSTPTTGSWCRMFTACPSSPMAALHHQALHLRLQLRPENVR